MIIKKLFNISSIVFALMISTFQGVYASNENYTSLLREGVRWEYKFINSDLITESSDVTTFYIEIKDSKILNDTIYKYCKAWSNANDTTILGYLREDVPLKRVYFKGSYDNSVEILLYDFNDIFQSYNLQWWKERFEYIKDVVVYDGISYDRFVFFDNSGEIIFYIIEGIGFVGNNLTKTQLNNGYLLNYPSIEQPDSKSYVISFCRLIDTKNESTIYEISSALDAINDNINKLEVNKGTISTKEQSYIKLFDVNGKMVKSIYGNTIETSSISPGLYFIHVKTLDYEIKTKVFIK